MHVPAYFGTRPQDVNAVCDIDIDEIARELSAQVEDWNSRGSGFIIERVSNFVICITKFRPLHGSSYIPTPKHILDKVCTVTVKKNRDQKCFVWSVLASLYPASDHVDRPTKYFPYEHSLNTTNFNFPLPVKDIPKFEIFNPSISVNVLSLDDKDFCIEYCSPERNRLHHVNLLLFSQGDKKHYICIKNMSRLVGDRTNHWGQTYVCNGCLHPFSSKDILDRHTPECMRNPPQAVKYPDPEDCTLKFQAHKNNSVSHFIWSAISNHSCPPQTTMTMTERPGSSTSTEFAVLRATA